MRLLLLLACALASTAHAASPQGAPTRGGSALVYDRDYPFVDYSGTPSHNAVARLEAQLRSGAVKLRFEPPAGYLRSLLAALRIDPRSQTLVFSKTSLQAQAISPQTPRAIYFNDDTYVAYIAHSGTLEINTLDSELGAVFYTLDNHEPAVRIEHETLRCLSCHDSFSLMGGGVPTFLFLSAYSRRGADAVTDTVATETTDQTPLQDRWGGWYVTGELGSMHHLGNILPAAPGAPQRVALSTGGVASLSGFFDTGEYLSDQSDVVALLVFEHQVSLHNLIIHASYKARMLLERDAPGSSRSTATFAAVVPLTQKRLAALLEPLVRGLLFVDAAPLPNAMHGDAGFDRWFEQQGPRDPQGRSLRDLDLQTRLFKYRLSFLIYSQGFDALPAYAKEYVYRRLAQILSGADTSATFRHLSAPERQAISEILRSTKPDYARALTASAANG